MLKFHSAQYKIILPALAALALAAINTITFHASASATTDTAASLVIDNNMIHNVIQSDTGETAYNSYKIAIKITDADSFRLQITAADGSSVNLQPENGTTQITGAGGATGDNLVENTWGYGWSSIDAKINELSYYTMPTYGTTGTSINNGLLESASADSNGEVDLTKQLTFAAKFGADAAPGHYTTQVLLSLAVSPKVVTETLADISDMQEMTKEICEASNVGDAATLNDTRGNVSYTVRKHSDKRCWMTQNLRLVGSRSLTTTDSNVTTNFSLPASSNAFGTANQTIAYYGNNVSYGGYYSWQAATAGIGTSSITSGEVTSSVCPKGWKLPTRNEYLALISAAGAANLTKTPYNFTLPGFYDDNSPNYTGSWGMYWTNTPYNSSLAYYLFLSGTAASVTTSDGSKAYGLSVRCVAAN